MVGLGPGNKQAMTVEALEALQQAEVIVGYSTYVKLVEPLLTGKKVISSGMKKEVDRARQALELAASGKHVAVISSGDPGVYGMAGPILEAAPDDLEIVIIPGVTAASAAAAVLGAPLMHDFAVISLSDLLTPWQTIVRRLEAATAADFVIVIYNPRSRGRSEHLEQARQIMLQHKSADTVAGTVRNCGRRGQEHSVTTLGALAVDDVDMFTTVVVGNSRTTVLHGRMVTPRGYML